MQNQRKKILDLKDISAGYNGEAVIKDVNLEIFQDDFVGVIGPNGGGKTTLIKVILGLIKPSKGKVNYYFDTEDTNAAIGYLPQVNKTDSKFPISVLDVVMSGYFGKDHLVKRFSQSKRENAIRILSEMGISGLKNRPIGELSGGQLQRVFLSRAIISNPRLLILDEPNTFVDNQFENELYRLLKKLNETMSIIMVSHDVGTISYYIKSIACVNKSVHYHPSNIISEDQLKAYNCPIQLITHGDVPHTVLHTHD